MVTMSAIWDRTAEVLRGRGGMLTGLAAAMLFLPAAVQNAFAVYGGRSPGIVALGGLVGLVVAIVTVWGNLALIAATSDPRVDRQTALGAAGRRVPLMIGFSLLLVLALALLASPILIILGTRIADVQALSAGTAPRLSPPSHGAIVAGLTYMMLLAALGIWLSARLSLLAPVVVNERRGLGSFARSFELTRDLTWRIIGVLVLFGVLLFVASQAARAVVGLIARLLLGAGGIATATYLGSLAGAAVVAGGTVVSATFLAQLYRVRSGREAAQAFD